MNETSVRWNHKAHFFILHIFHSPLFFFSSPNICFWEERVLCVWGGGVSNYVYRKPLSAQIDSLRVGVAP